MLIIKKTHNSYAIRYNQPNPILRFGQFGIKIMVFKRLTLNQVNSIERSFLQIVKKVVNGKKSNKIWNLLTLNLKLTKLSSESRMGKGKGAVYTKAVFLKPGTILFEFDGVSNQQMLEIFHFVRKKLSFKILLVERLR